MESAVEAFFSTHVAQFIERLSDLNLQTDGDDYPNNEQALTELTQSITQVLDACAKLQCEIESDAELLKATQVRFRAAIWPWFEKSWMMQRAFTKPCGYPGDYLLLTSIYEREPKSRGLGGYLDRYFLNTTLGRAVPARMRAIRQFLSEEVARRGGKARILNVASGPCREYLNDFLAAEAREVNITCIDNDTQALEFVQKNVVPTVSSRINLRFQRYNALRMVSGKANSEQFGKSDIIYSVGLCDYIPDDYLVPMLRGWRESLAEGGLVYVAFKDMELYDKAEYQWLADWYFYQRTLEDCRNLFVEAGYNMEQMEIVRTEMAVIIAFVGRTSSPSTIRIDGAAMALNPSHLNTHDDAAVVSAGDELEN
jgi:extracellular factor (EF) 3-hydroxypalmitic acid methyl ester biosynthesis protein